MTTMQVLAGAVPPGVAKALIGIGSAVPNNALRHSARATALAVSRERARNRVKDELLRAPSEDPDILAVQSVDGTSLHVEARGPVDAPPIVFSHGWTCSIEVWNAQVNALSGDFRVITYDQRGHGRTPTGPRPLSTDTLADDLGSVLAATVRPGRKAVVVGHSMGGMAVIAWAGRHPEQVGRFAKAAVLASTATDRLLADLGLIRLPESPSWATRAIGQVALTTPVPLGLIPPWGFRYVAMGSRTTPAQLAFSRHVVNSCAGRNRARWGAALNLLDLGASLEALAVPTTVVCGTADRLTPPVHSRRMATALESVGHLHRLVQFDGVGHMSQVEAPIRFNAELRRLTALPNAAPRRTRSSRQRPVGLA